MKKKYFFGNSYVLPQKNWYFQRSITGEPVYLEKNKKFPISQILLATRDKNAFVDTSYGFRAMMPNVRCSFKKKDTLTQDTKNC